MYDDNDVDRINRNKRDISAATATIGGRSKTEDDGRDEKSKLISE